MQATDYELDTANLLALRGAALDWVPGHATEDLLAQWALQGMQALAQVLGSLPREETEEGDVGMLIQLPAPQLKFPRTKPIPEAKPLTRWETFAKAKGIKKRKRDRLVYDELEGDYKPRYGSARAVKADDDWVIEHREGMDAEADPFEARAADKKKKIARNKENQMKNLEAAKGARVPGTIDLNSLTKSAKPDRAADKQAKKHHVDVALDIAQRATASMGKFDKLARKEPAPKKVRVVKKGGATQKMMDSIRSGVKDENKSQMKILSRIVGNASAPSIDVGKAVSKRKQRTEKVANRKKSS